MEKLTVKEIAGYFAFKLKVLIKGRIVELTDMRGEYSISTQPQIRGFKYCSFEDFKPILYPLSMLTQEIEHNGEKFVPIVKLFDIGAEVLSVHATRKSFCVVFNINDEDITYEIKKDARCEPYWVMEKLFEWHFDVFDLIEKRIAVDKNEIIKTL